MSQPVFVVADRVLFPGGLLRLSVGKPKSVRLVESLLGSREGNNYLHSGGGGGGGGAGGPTILLAIFTQRCVCCFCVSLVRKSCAALMHAVSFRTGGWGEKSGSWTARQEKAVTLPPPHPVTASGQRSRCPLFFRGA